MAIRFRRCTDGVTRTVYLVGPWAFKCASLKYSWRLFLRGMLSNLNERDTYRWSSSRGWDEHGVPRRHLARVLWCDRFGLVLCMERAERTVTQQEWLDLPQQMFRCSDMKPENVGVFADGIRVIDYGEGWTAVEAEHERRGTLGEPTECR